MSVRSHRLAVCGDVAHQVEQQASNGVPITIGQTDNYARAENAYLPTLQISGLQISNGALPVVQLIDEATGEPVYTLRIPEKTWRPPVFWSSSYTIRVGEGDHVRQMHGIQSTDKPNEATLRIDL